MIASRCRPTALVLQGGLVLLAIALLWATAPAEIARLAAPPLGNNDASDLTTGATITLLGLAACATGVLTLHYPGRPNVSLMLLPALLAWWQLGPATAALLAGFGALFGNAWRRAPAAASLAGGARTAVGVWLAGYTAALVPAALGTSAPAQFTSWWLAAVLVFVVIASAVDWLGDWLERRSVESPMGVDSVDAGRGTFLGWNPGGGARGLVRISRQDPLVNILVLPLAVAFQLVDAALGFERMAIVLGGMLVLLFVVRALTNLRTAYGTLAEQRIKLATLFDHSGEGIYTVDGDLRIDTLNPAMAELLGQPAEALARRECAAVCRFQDLHGQRLCPDRCPLVRAHATRLPVSEEVLYQLPDQPPRHLLLTYASVGEPGEPLSLGIGIARDMTAEREAAKLRDEFVSLVTHELRSPLTVSIGYIELLKRALSGATQPLDPQKGTYYVGRIESAERHLLRLVNNLLELARVERPDLELELGWVDLGRLIEETVDGIRTLANEKQQTVTLDLPAGIPVIWSAELYLKEVFSNLTSNAVKYTPEGGSVAVTVRVHPARGDWRDGNGMANGAAVPSLASGVVEVVVRDTGYGMSDEDQARLFSKFFRSGRPEIRKERGTGLGLALTKTMIEKIGGTITVQSALGQGSAFTVRLPLTTRAPDGSPAPAPARLLANAGDPGPATAG